MQKPHGVGSLEFQNKSLFLRFNPFIFLLFPKVGAQHLFSLEQLSEERQRALEGEPLLTVMEILFFLLLICVTFFHQAGQLTGAPLPRPPSKSPPCHLCLSDPQQTPSPTGAGYDEQKPFLTAPKRIPQMLILLSASHCG